MEGRSFGRLSYDADGPSGLLKILLDVRAGVDEKIERSTLKLFNGSRPVDDGTDGGGGGNDEEKKEEVSRTDIAALVKPFRRPMFDDEGQVEQEESIQTDSSEDDDNDDDS